MAVSGPSSAFMTIGPPAPAAAYFPITISCWLFCPNNPSAENAADYFLQLLTTIGGNNANIHPHAVSTGTTPNVSWQFGVNISQSASGTFDYTTSNTFFPGWHHFAVTVSDTGTAGTFGANGMLEYIDATYVPPGAQPGANITGFANTPSTTSFALQPGSLSGSLYVAYPAVWTSILTQFQLQQLAGGTDPRIVSPGTLKSYTQYNSTTSPTDLVYGSNWGASGGTFTLQTDPYSLPPAGINIIPVGATGTTANPGTTNPLTIADTWTNLAGDLRYVWVTGPIQVTNVTDTAGNAYTSYSNAKSTATNYFNALYVCLNCKAAATNTVSVTFASAPTSATEIATGEIDAGPAGAAWTTSETKAVYDGTSDPTTPFNITTTKADVILAFPNLLGVNWYLYATNQWAPLGPDLWNLDQPFYRVVNPSGTYPAPQIELQTGTGAAYILVAGFGVTYTPPVGVGGTNQGAILHQFLATPKLHIGMH